MFIENVLVRLFVEWGVKTLKAAANKKSVGGSVGVSKEAAAEFSKFCRSAGYRISFAAEQALAAWVREHAGQVKK